jgi:hypothetical protein
MVLQALKDRIYDDASNYATHWLAELPHVSSSQLCYGLFTLLSGLWIRSCTIYQRRFRRSTDPVLRGRRGRANTTHRHPQPRRTKTQCCHETSSSRPIATSLP